MPIAYFPNGTWTWTTAFICDTVENYVEGLRYIHYTCSTRKKYEHLISRQTEPCLEILTHNFFLSINLPIGYDLDLVDMFK